MLSKAFWLFGNISRRSRITIKTHTPKNPKSFAQIKKQITLLDAVVLNCLMFNLSWKSEDLKSSEKNQQTSKIDVYQPGEILT